MYIYFNVDETLKEIVQTPVRQGSVAHNKIYIYVEPTIGQPVGNVYHLPAAYTHAKIDFAAVDEDLNLNPNGGNSVIMTKVTNIEIPYDNKRDLYFFKYGYKYEMWMVELPTSVTSYNGKVKATAYIYNGSEQVALNTFAFNVESSVGVILDSTMTQSQYSYLLNYITSFYVPYSGATDNLDLGGNSLKLGGYSEIFEDEAGLVITNSNGNILLVPYTYLRVSTYIVSNGYELYGMQAGLGKDADNSITLYNNDGDINVDCYGQFKYKGSEVATHDDLPKKGIIATFNTNYFATQDDGTKRLVILGIQNYISNSDLLVITWGGCFAICPIPQSGPGRVCAALWNANGESEITRIRYQLDQLESGLALTITLPGNFQLPSNFTGYVIDYKIA